MARVNVPPPPQNRDWPVRAPRDEWIALYMALADKRIELLDAIRRGEELPPYMAELASITQRVAKVLPRDLVEQINRELADE